MEFSECDYDTLSEIFNVGIGKASDLLSQIVKKKIILQIPRILVLKSPEEFQSVPELAGLVKGTLMVSSLSFTEQLAGTANLVFPAEKMRDFITLCTEEEAPCENGSTEFTDVDFDVIKEIGNIFLNCILGSVGDFLSVPMSYSVPAVKVYDRAIDFGRNVMTEECPSVLFLAVTFVIDSVKIEGAILVSLAMDSCDRLLQYLRGIEENLYEL